MTRLVTLVLVLLCNQALAAGLQPLTTDSLTTLNQRYSGVRHAIIYWSLDCLPCRDELQQLGTQLTGRKVAISLVNTDRRERQPQAADLLRQYGVRQLDNWQFADPVPARLRAAIDPNWYGALPRSYAITASGKVYPHTGKTPLPQLLRWLQASQSTGGR